MNRLFVVIVVILAVFVAVVTGCSDSRHYDSRLVEADRLMFEHPDSALVLIEAISLDSLTDDGDRAYRDLLLTHARQLCHIPVTSDSIINRAIKWFSADSIEIAKLVRAYVIKGNVMEELGHPDSAMLYYKTAELIANQSNLEMTNLQDRY